MIKLNISNGNRKMGAIPSFSLPSGRTCSSVACRTCYLEGCYADAMEKRLPNVRNAWQKNMDLLQEDLEGCKQFLNWYFDNPNAPRLFRIHVGGDFFSYDYFCMWLDVIREHPNTLFMAFTKQFSVIINRCLVIGLPDNLVLIASAWPRIPLPDWVPGTLPIAYMQDGNEDRIPENAWICDGDCAGSCSAHCWNMRPGDAVVFKKHGPGVRKEKKHD